MLPTTATTTSTSTTSSSSPALCAGVADSRACSDLAALCGASSKLVVNKDQVPQYVADACPGTCGTCGVAFVPPAAAHSCDTAAESPACSTLGDFCTSALVTLKVGKQDVPVYLACRATCKTCALPTSTTTSSATTTSSTTAARCNSTPDSADCHGLANLCTSGVKFIIEGAEELRLMPEACPGTCGTCAGNG